MPRPPLTHFLCLPLVTASSRSLLQTSLETFRAEAVSPTEASTVRIPEKAIRPLGTLHLTIGVMSLQSQDRIDACLTFLRGLDVHDLLRRAEEASPVAFESSTGGPIEAIDEPSTGTPNSKKVPNVPGESSGRSSPPSPLIISLSGLHSMHSPTSTSVLYALPVDPTCRLVNFCQSLRQLFTGAAFILPEDRPLRLHATIVNTVYARKKSVRANGGGHGRSVRGRSGFNATGWIERYEGLEWAAGLRLEEVAVCEMGAKQVEGDGVQYLEVGSVSLP